MKLSSIIPVIGVGVNQGGGGDVAAPTVTGFTATTPSPSLDVPITLFTASEAGTSFLITASSTPPLPDAAGWSALAPETYTVAAEGAYTLYPWVKDAAGNVSSVYETPVSVNVIIFELREDFTTDDAAPVTNPRTTEPGPGTMVPTDTGSIMSITGSKLSSTGVTVNNSDPRLVSQGTFARALGKVLSGKFNLSGRIYVGWGANNTASPQGHAFNVVGNAAFGYINPTAINIAFPVLTANVDYQWAMAMQSVGAIALIKGGTQHSAWHILWVDNTQNGAMYAGAGVANGSGAWTVDELHIATLKAPFNAAYGLCTYYDATPTANDVATGNADGSQYFEWTPASNETLSLYFRRTDDDNCHRLDCAQAGGTIKLYRREAGVDTELDAGKTQTFTAGTKYRVVIHWYGTTLMTYVNTTRKHNTTTTVFNQSSTGVKCTGFATGSNWEVYPYELPAAAVTELERCTNP